MAQQAEILDVLIVGTGIAGLSAALALQDKAAAQNKPLSLTVLEAAQDIGGRAISLTHGGVTTSPGAAWFHGGEDNAFFQWLAKRYGDIPARDDHYNNSLYFQHRQPVEDHILIVWQKLAATYETFKQSYPDEDLSLMQLADLDGHPEAREIATLIARNWMALEDAGKVSADELFGDDVNTPGGKQPTGGMGAPLQKMAAELTARGGKILTDARVAHVETQNDIVTVTAADGQAWRARSVVVAVPVGVLKARHISFAPALSPATLDYLDHVQPAHFTKIIVPLQPGYLDRQGFTPNGFVHIRGFEPDIFAHVYSAGQPVITVMAGGGAALQMEKMTAVEIESLTGRLLAEVPGLENYKAHQTAPAFVTRWNSDPLFLGAYSAMVPGHRRQDPKMEGRITLAGEFMVGAENPAAGPGSIMGAFHSGLLAADRIHDLLHPGNRPSPRTGTRFKPAS